MITARFLAFALALTFGQLLSTPRASEASDLLAEFRHSDSGSLEELRDDLITRLESQTLNPKYETDPVETLRAFLKGLDSIDVEGLSLCGGL